MWLSPGIKTYFLNYFKEILWTFNQTLYLHIIPEFLFLHFLIVNFPTYDME